MIHPQSINIRPIRLAKSASDSAWQFVSNFRFYQKQGHGYALVVRDMMLLEDTINDVYTDIVKDMRADGISWNEIGDAFGITRQAARVRFMARGIR
jgi:hypothetical protein